MRQRIRAFRDWLARPTVQRAFNGWSTVFWAANLPLALATDIKNSVPYLITISVWALFQSSLGAWVSSIVACRQSDDADVSEVLNKLDEIDPDSAG